MTRVDMGAASMRIVPRRNEPVATMVVFSWSPTTTVRASGARIESESAKEVSRSPASISRYALLNQEAKTVADDRERESIQSPFGRMCATGLALLFSPFDLVLGALGAILQVSYSARHDGRWATPRRSKRGLIVILGGIEGPSIYQRLMAGGLLRGGWRGAICVYRWNRGWPGIRVLQNLMSRAHHERESDAVRDLINAYRTDYPQAPVGILALSGGCWIAVRALEKLDPTDKVHAAVLLAPAISRHADLTRAASACATGLTLIRSPGDVLLLGIGTCLLGTSDRRLGPGCGLVGGHGDTAGVHDVVWRPAWVRWGYVGTHVTVASPCFIAHRVVHKYTSPGKAGNRVEAGTVLQL
jgi:hypothetical protein